MRSIPTLGLALAAVFTFAGFAAGESRQIVIRDYTMRGFAPDVVTYELPAGVKGDRLSVADEKGVPVAVQVAPGEKGGPATLSFIAEVAPDAAARYKLTDEGGASGASSLKVEKDGDALVLGNALLAVRVPGEGAKTYATPVAASTLPAPVLAFRSGAQGAWLGSAKILSPRLVRASSVKLLARGPVFATLEYRIEWADGGYYRAELRVADRVPLVRVSEEYDLGKMTSDADLWELDVTKGWSPDSAEIAKTWGNGGVDLGRVAKLADVKLAPLQPSGAYGDMMSQLGLFNEADAKAKPDAYTMVGLVPLHQGHWRRVATLDLLAPAPGQVKMQLPMTRTPPLWVETSPFCVITHENELPYTYARRVWALVLAKPALEAKDTGNQPIKPFYAARVFYGVVGLDRYKDYVTTWPSKMPSYPRGLFDADDVAKTNALGDTPLAAQLAKSFNAFGADPANFKQKSARRSLDHYNRYLMTTPTPSHHHMYEGTRAASLATDALAWKDMPADERADLLARLATFAYLMNEPDLMGNANGAHVGNPNMSIARQSWLPNIIALLPDHPMYEKWRDFIATYNEYKLADNMAPGGGWFEFGNYHVWGYGRLIEGMFGSEAMKPANLDKQYAYHTADMDYLLNLISPVDPRFRARIVPGLGNSSNKYLEHYLEAAGTFAKRDPAFASNLMWAWQANGSQPVNFPATIKPWIQPKEPALTSRVYPGFGVVFRAHQGPDETYMLFRSGFLWSHWTVDQNHLVLNSKGAPLLTGHSFTYYDTPDKNFSQYNDIRFGHPSNEFHFSWPDSNILAHHFGERVQYAWSSSGYPAWYIKPGRVPRYGPPPMLAEGDQKEGDFTWDRQVAFLPGKTGKSPNYFVVRDTISGEGKLKQWFNMNALGRKGDITVDGERLAINTEWPTKLDVIFPGKKLAPPEMFEDDTLLDCPGGPYWPTFLRLNEGKPISKNWRRKDGKAVDLAAKAPLNPDIEQHVLMHTAHEPGADHFWLLYPRGEGEASPKVTRPSANMVKVTHAEGVDYLVLAASNVKADADDVKAEASAAAVRVRGDEVTLAILKGVGRVEYKGYAIEGVGPFEKTVKLASVKAGVEKVSGDAKNRIAYTPALKDHAELSPGVKKASSGANVEYVVDSASPVVLVEGDVTIEATRAVIVRSERGVRFVVPVGTYAKLTSGTSGVRGVGPFDLTFTNDTITGEVKGDARSIVVTKPANIIRPMFHLDGVRWYAGYSDDTAPFRGRSDPQFSLAFGVTKGDHKVEVREAVYPPLPPSPARAKP